MVRSRAKARRLEPWPRLRAVPSFETRTFVRPQDEDGAATRGLSAPVPQRREIRQLLLDAPDVGPGIALERAEALADVEHRVLVRRLNAAEFVPGHLCRHRGSI